MSKMTAQEKEQYRKVVVDKVIRDTADYNWNSEPLKHWRAWGSWFSWGSPVGLGLFFIAAAITIWIIRQAF